MKFDIVTPWVTADSDIMRLLSELAPAMGSLRLPSVSIFSLKNWAILTPADVKSGG